METAGVEPAEGSGRWSTSAHGARSSSPGGPGRRWWAEARALAKQLSIQSGGETCCGASQTDLDRLAVERDRLLATLFEEVWQDAGVILAVTPYTAFTGCFQDLTETAETQSGLIGVQSGSDGT